MKSMTGYGTSQSKNRQLEIEVHVKSVNGRFLEIRFHVPKEYSPFENDLRKLFNAKWDRGTVDVYIHRRPGAETRLQTVNVRVENARHWTRQVKALAKSLGIPSDVSVRDILQMPYVLEHQDRLSLLPGELKLVQEQVRKASAECLTFRAREGAMLKKELLAQMENLQSSIVDMEKWRLEATASAPQRLKSRLSALSIEPMDASRLALETALILDKMDIQEEIVRLREHVNACQLMIQESASNKMAGAAPGKRLDFYCQELLREVNTIGSKSQLASLTQAVVVAKSVIEKFREQVQNVE